MTEDEAAYYRFVGDRIRRARSDAAMTQGVLADRIAARRTTVSSIEGGRQTVAIHTLVGIAAALKVPVEALMPDFTVAAARHRLGAFSPHVVARDGKVVVSVGGHYTAHDPHEAIGLSADIGRAAVRASAGLSDG